MERDLGISYPTVRSRLDALVRALGFGEPAESIATDTDPDTNEPAPEPPATRREILERLALKEITAEEAAAAIRALPRSRS
jgi:hypothetical protein